MWCEILMQIKIFLDFIGADNQRLLKFLENIPWNNLPVRENRLILHPQSGLSPVPLRNSGFEGLTRREIFEEIPID